MSIGISILIFFASIIALVAEFVLYMIFGMGASFSGDISSLAGTAFFFIGVMIITGACGFFAPFCAIIGAICKNKSIANKIFMWIIIAIGLFYFIGASLLTKTIKSEITSETNQGAVLKKEVKDQLQTPISRTFEDLTLGMSEYELELKLNVFGGRPREGRSEIAYIAYGNGYANGSDARMKSLDNIYNVYCNFFENRLMQIDISYNINFVQGWETFISKAKQKYGKGKEGINKIVWNDGITTLQINKTYGAQKNNYGAYFSVNYSDNSIIEEWTKEQSNQGPQF